MKQQQTVPGIGYCLKSAAIGGSIGVGGLLIMASVLAALELTAGIGESSIKMLMRLSLVVSSLAASRIVCAKARGRELLTGAGSILMMGIFLLLLGSLLNLGSIPPLKGVWLPVILGATAGMLLTGKGRGGQRRRSKHTFTG